MSPFSTAPAAGAPPETCRRARRPRFNAARALGAIVAAALLVAACGATPGASVGTGSTGSSGTGTQASPGASTRPFEQALAFSACMRSHGLPDFPDPVQGAGGGVSLQLKGGPGGDLNPNSPQFKAAQQACQHLQPQGMRGGGGATDLQQALQWAACMRSHGLPRFPDPTVSDGVPQLDLSGTGIDPGSPQFQSAQQACKSLGPGRIAIRNINPAGGQP